MSANWGKDAWDQYDKVCSHLDGGIDFVKRMQQFTKERMKIEADYAKELRKLSKSYQRRKEDDQKYSDVAAFYTVVKEVDDMAGQHEIIVENSNSNVYEALRRLQHDLQKEKKQLMSDGSKHASTYHQGLSNLEKAKKKYEAATQDAERAQQIFDKASQDMNLTRAAVEKHRQLSMSKNDQAEEAKGNYLVCLDQTNQLQREHFFTRMPEVFSSFQRMEESRVDTVKQLMNTTLDIEMAVQPIFAKCRENIRGASNSMDGTKDSVTFVDDNRTGYLPPTDKVFEEYSSSKGKTAKSLKPAATGPREDFGHLPPAKRKKKLQGKVKELEDAVKKESAEHAALEKMYGVYSANPSLGDPSVVQQQLGVLSDRIDQINDELFKFESYLSQAEGRDPPQRRSSPGKPALQQANSAPAAAPAAAATPPTQRAQAPAQQNAGIPHAPPPPTTAASVDEFEEEFDVSYVTVLYDFVGSNDGELSVNAGEKIELVENDNSGWIQVKKGGQQGYIPLTYVDVK